MTEIIAQAATKTITEAALKEGGKLAEVIGAFCPFFDVKRKAVEEHISNIKNSDMPPETKVMAILNTKKTFKELENQSKIAKIAQENAKEDTDFSQSSGVDDDWLARYMDSAKFVSNEEMQLIWGNILAKEFETPGSTPPQITRILSEITPVYARAFNTLCNLASKIVTPAGVHINNIIADSNDAFFHSLSINFGVLSELENLGLIKFEPLAGFINKFSKKDYPELRLAYNDNTAVVIDYPDKAFPVGKVMLTNAGKCVANIVKTKEVEGYWDNLINYLTKQNVKIQC